MTATPARKLDDVPLLCGEGLRRVLALLQDGGGEARLVGGAVRNLLMGMPITDIDIGTTLPPEEVLRHAGAAGVRAIPTGIEHGTVTLMVEGVSFEVTTLRRDLDTDGRRATVAFGRDWAEDARRRDFTFNALSLDGAGHVYDYTGGLEDLMARRVRFIGDARARIREDFLRTLRFFRFHAAYGAGEADRAALDACVAERGGLPSLSRERVRAELLKLLVAPRAAETVRLMADFGLLGFAVPGVARVSRMARLGSVDDSHDALLRLGALGVVVAEDAERLFSGLRLSRDEFQRLLAMSDGLPWPRPEVAEPGLRAMLYRLGARAYRDRALLAWSDARDADDAAWRRVAALPERWSAPRLPWAGRDLVAAGVPAGPSVGRGLAEMERRWAGMDFPRDEAVLRRILDDVVSGLAPG